MSISPRLMRTGLLLGEQGIEALQQATVMVAGVGAVGGYALEAVARAGVGHLILVDFDVFDETNINRQILALGSTVGRKKIEVAKGRVLDINPHCAVEVRDVFINDDTLPALLDEKVDFVIDAIDSLSSKCSLIEALLARGIPFISSMGAALRTDTSFIKLGTLDKTKNCGLAKHLRQRLRRRGADIKKVRCVYSDEPAGERRKQAVVVNANPEERNVLGSLPTITAIFGLMMAHEVIKILAYVEKGE